MMRGRWLPAVAAVAALACTGLAAAPAKKQPQKAAAQRDWTRTIVATPEGGFRMGNPAAPVKLVEYSSLTCPHCAHFVAEGVPQLVQKHVRTGRVSFELRNFVRNPYDMAGALLSRCAGPAGFFGLTERIFATQEQWTGRVSALSEAQRVELNALPRAAQLARIASITGFDGLATRFGVPAARAKSCLADEKAALQAAEVRKVAVERYNLQGTPTFVINGTTAAGVHDWASLEPLLKPPGG